MTTPHTEGSMVTLVEAELSSAHPVLLASLQLDSHV